MHAMTTRWYGYKGRGNGKSQFLLAPNLKTNVFKSLQSRFNIMMSSGLSILRLLHPGFYPTHAHNATSAVSCVVGLKRCILSRHILDISVRLFWLNFFV